MIFTKHISGIEMQQDGPNMVPIGPDMGLNEQDMGSIGPCMDPKGLEEDEKPYTDFIFPEYIPEHDLNRNAA